MSGDHGDDDTMPDGAAKTPRERPVESLFSPRGGDSKRELIDRSMRLAFEESLSEPLSPELQALVDKLADKEKSQ